MSKDNKTKIRDFIVKNSKFLFPVLVIVVAAITVSFALNANRKKTEQEESTPSTEVSATTPVNLAEEGSEGQPQETEGPKLVPLTPNENEGIQNLINTYYNSMQLGDSAGMAALYDKLTDEEKLRCEEMAKYVNYVSNLEVYTKEGPEAGATVVYVSYIMCFLNHEEEIPGWQTFFVCEDGQGGYYIKNEKNLTEEEKNYVEVVSLQDDTIELNNRVTAQYNELMEANQQLLLYLGELGDQVDVAVGVRLAEQVASNTPAEGDGTAPAEGTDPAAGGAENPAEGTPAQTGPQSAVATTTVNVRNSDSEQADRIGQVIEGTRVQVQEVRANGWTKVVYDGGDGYIKSEYLQMEESVEGQEVIGTVTANTNVNVRAAASETAEQVGILVGGDSAELLATENGWCKIKYDGKVAYVKAEFVTQ